LSSSVTSASIFKKVLETRDADQSPIENAPLQSESDVDVTELLNALELRELAKLLDKRLKG